VFAAGDCVEKINLITGKPEFGHGRASAVIQGRLVAKRLAGYDIPFPGVLNSLGARLFDKFVGAAGLTEDAAKESGIPTVSSVIDSRSKHAMIAGCKPWTLKLIFNRENKKIIGGQILSGSDAPVKEIDSISSLIRGGMTMYDLTTYMGMGHPDISSEPSAEPIALAGEQALQKIR
jgi:NADH dehydrogenase/NADH oxidase (H2O2-forming)